MSYLSCAFILLVVYLRKYHEEAYKQVKLNLQTFYTVEMFVLSILDIQTKFLWHQSLEKDIYKLFVFAGIYPL